MQFVQYMQMLNIDVSHAYADAGHMNMSVISLFLSFSG